LNRRSGVNHINDREMERAYGREDSDGTETGHSGSDHGQRGEADVAWLLQADRAQVEFVGETPVG